jgi:hypothetical protein
MILAALAIVVATATPRVTATDVSLWVDPRISQRAVLRALDQLNAAGPVRWHIGGPGIQVDVRIGDPGAGNAAVANLRHRGEAIVSADIVIRRRYAEAALLHELGHVLGLPHSSRCPGDVMCPRVDEQGSRFTAGELAAVR